MKRTGFSKGDAADHTAGLRERKCCDNFPGSVRNIVGGKESIAQICHRHDKIVGKPRYVRMVSGEKRNYDSDRGKYGSIQKRIRKDRALNTSPVFTGRIRKRIIPPAYNPRSAPARICPAMNCQSGVGEMIT